MLAEKRLTEEGVRKLTPPKSGTLEQPDKGAPGLILRVGYGGAKSWVVRHYVRVTGKNGVTSSQPRYHGLGKYPDMDLKAAREAAIQFKANPQAFLAQPEAKKEEATIENAVKEFVTRYAQKQTRQNSARETDRILNREVIGAWKGRNLKDIGRKDVHALLDGIMDRDAPIMANQTLAALRKMLNWAVERGIIEASPCAGIKAPGQKKSRNRVLDDEELKLVWQACDKLELPFGPLFKLLALTGQRRGEVAEMRWSEIDLAGKTWTVPKDRAKNGVEHDVPLSPQALMVLESLPRIAGCDFVFSTTGQTAVSGFSKAKGQIDKALPPNTPAWVLHDLRRTAATGMARLGVNLPVIEKVLNHVSGSFAGIVGVYQRHSFVDEKKAALVAWGAHVGELCADESESEMDEMERNIA